MGIYTVLDFYRSPVWKLKAAFHSITGLYWHLRLSGFEVDNIEFARRRYGNSVALGSNISKVTELSPILARLTEKMCSRLRSAGYRAKGIHLMLIYKNGSWWHRGRLLDQPRFDSRDFYKAAFRLLLEANPASNVLNIAVSCFGLTKENSIQLNFLENIEKKQKLVKAIDEINEKWGNFTMTLARSRNGAGIIKDRIAFGGIKEIEEFTIG